VRPSGSTRGEPTVPLTASLTTRVTGREARGDDLIEE
jgi:hypothetical protein